MISPILQIRKLSREFISPKPFFLHKMSIHTHTLEVFVRGDLKMLWRSPYPHTARGPGSGSHRPLLFTLLLPETVAGQEVG